MKLVEGSGSVTALTISMSSEELQIINAALNEVSNGIAILEFETRIGSDRDKVSKLQKEVGAVLDAVESKGC